MAKLQDKVKNALDEGRILVLGVQVLLGFQYRAFLEKGFEKLPPSAQATKAVGLLLLLLVFGMCLLPAARHCLVEEGRDTGRFLRFTMRTVELALFPFALALGLDFYLPGLRIGGERAGVLLAVAATLGALGLWYGVPLATPGRAGHHPEEDAVETPIKDRIVQVLTEARVVLPGAQALLGFQFAMVLMEPFDDLPGSSKLVHLVSLCFVSLATAFLMAPAAYHRIVERGEETERFHRFASRMVVLAQVALAPGLCGELFVVFRKWSGSLALSLAATLGALAFLYGLWFGFTLLLKARLQAQGKLRRRAA